MVTVRFPNGQTVQYNNANFLERYDRYTLLRTKQDGALVAQAFQPCIIEFQSPCRVYNALTNEPDEKILKELKSINRRLKKLEG